MMEEPRTSGLLNLSNNCYLNSVLQLLSRIPGIQDSVKNHVHVGEVQQTCVSCILLRTITRLLKGPGTPPFFPKELLDWLKEEGKGQRFNDGEQCDPLEVIDLLFEHVESNLLRHGEAARAFCPGCMNEDSGFQPSQPAGIGIRMSMESFTDSTDMQIIVQQYLQQSMDRLCPQCGSLEQEERQITSAPEVLMVSLERHEMINNTSVKNMIVCVANPSISISISNGEILKYRILGTINHIGSSVSCGHYVAKVTGMNNTFTYSDTKIEEERSAGREGEVVIAFYVKEGFSGETNCKVPDISDVPTFTEDEVIDALNTTANENQKKNEKDFETSVLKFVKRYTRTYKFKLLHDTKILVMLIPKSIEGNNFCEKYKNFLESNETVLYTIVRTVSSLFKKIRSDKFVKEHYDIYRKPVEPKLGEYHTREWIAKASMCFIIHSLIYTGGPKLEFMFNLYPKGAVTVFLREHWESSKEAVCRSLPRLMENNLFCLETCNINCVTNNDPFHFCLKGMVRVEPLAETYENSLAEFTFVDNYDAIIGHPLETLLTPLDPEYGITSQILSKITSSESLMTDTTFTYMLMVVNNAPKHDPWQLLDLWLGSTAYFGVYVGCTSSGPYRKAHLSFGQELTSVNKVLNSSSTVYLVMSQRFENRKDAEEAEALLIAALKYHEKFELKTGLSNRFEILNVVNSNYPLHNASKESGKSLEQFINSKSRLFVFQGEKFRNPSITSIGDVLQNHLVDIIIKHPLTL